MKVNKTAVIVSILIGVGAWAVCDSWMSASNEPKFGFGVFLFSLVILHAKPELMGKLHEPDNGEKEEDT